MPRTPSRTLPKCNAPSSSGLAAGARRDEGSSPSPLSMTLSVDVPVPLMRSPRTRTKQQSGTADVNPVLVGAEAETKPTAKTAITESPRTTRQRQQPQQPLPVSSSSETPLRRTTRTDRLRSQSTQAQTPHPPQTQERAAESIQVQAPPVDSLTGEQLVGTQSSSSSSAAVGAVASPSKRRGLRTPAASKIASEIRKEATNDPTGSLGTVTNPLVGAPIASSSSSAVPAPAPSTSASDLTPPTSATPPASISRRTSARERRERRPFDPAAAEAEQRQRSQQQRQQLQVMQPKAAGRSVRSAVESRGQTQTEGMDVDTQAANGYGTDGRQASGAAKASEITGANGRPIKPLRRGASSSGQVAMANPGDNLGTPRKTTGKKRGQSQTIEDSRVYGMGAEAVPSAQAALAPVADEAEEEESEVDPVWEDFSADYHEVVEQLPLELHRNFALLRELDDQTRQHTVKLLETVRKYVVARLGIERVPEGHALRQEVGAQVEARTERPAVETVAVNGHASPNGSAAQPADGSQDPAPQAPVRDAQASASAIATASPPRPGTSAYDAKLRSLGLTPASSALLPELARLSREVVQGADDQLGVAQGAYNSVDRHIRALDSALQQQQQHQQQQAGGVATEAGPPSIVQPVAASAAPVEAQKPQKIKKGRKPKADKGKEKEGPAQDGLVVENVPEVSDNPLIDGAATPALGEMAVDPHEPRYCLCHNVAFGEMLGCDNDDCPIEWYHLSCLGLDRAPTGTWICDVCTGAIAKRTQQVVAEKKHKKRRARF